MDPNLAQAMAAAVTINRNKHWWPRFFILYCLPLFLLICFANFENSILWLSYLLGSKISSSLSGFQQFIRDNSQGFLVLLGIGIYFEYISGPRNVDLTQDAIDKITNKLREPARGLSTAQQLEYYIRNIYPGFDTKSLASLVYCDRPPLYDTDVELELSDNSSENTFTYSCTINFKSNIDRLVIALTTDALAQERALRIPGVQFSRALPKNFVSVEDADIYAKSIIIRLVSEKGADTTKLCRMQNAEISKLAKICGAISRDEIFLYYLPVKIGSSSRVSIRFPSVNLQKDCHYVFWLADRPMYLRSVKIDAQNFNAVGRNRFNLQCFIHDARHEDHDYRKSGKVNVIVENWVSYSQGLVFSWR